MRRFDLVERIATSRDWPPQLRHQPPLATSPTHSTHLGERTDATVGRMFADGLLDRPRRGYYALSAAGRREARKRAAATKRPPGTGSLRGAARPTGAGGQAPSAPGPLPVWAHEIGVGRWRPFEPISAPTTAAPTPFSWDADEKDAQTQEHHDVLNRLHAVLRRAGVDVAYSTARPACDLAFRVGETFTFVEAKSLPPGSDEHQLRLGLGQAIQYRTALADEVGGAVRAVLAVPRAPAQDRLWRRACQSADVTLLVVGPATRGLRKALLG